MGSPCPPRWNFAERAAYFGERICAFCGHRNPAGARFCNDCASPLELKPCKQCDGVNDHAATSCHHCGEAYPVPAGTPERTGALLSADPAPDFDATGRSLTPRELIVAALAAIVSLGAYDAYRVHGAKPAVMETAEKAPPAPETYGTTATAAAPADAESKPVEPEQAAPVQLPVPADTVEATQRAPVGQRQAPVPRALHASAHQHPVPARHVPAGKTTAAAHRPAVARGGARVAHSGKARRQDPSPVMHVSLASCEGDLLARIVCDQRVRRDRCEGRWGEAPECPSGIVNEHGQ
jgi:hypothetical protein